MTVSPKLLGDGVLLHQVCEVFRCKDGVERAVQQIPALASSQTEKGLVGKYDTKVIVDDDHTLVERFEDILHLKEPIGLLKLGPGHERHLARVLQITAEDNMKKYA